MTALPEEYHIFLQFNPLTFIIEQARVVMIWGRGMNWIAWVAYWVFTALVAWLGFAWSQTTDLSPCATYDWARIQTILP